MHFVLVKFAHLGKKSEQVLVVTCNNEGFLQRMITQGSQTISRCTMVTRMTTSLSRQRRDFRCGIIIRKIIQIGTVHSRPLPGGFLWCLPSQYTICLRVNIEQLTLSRVSRTVTQASLSEWRGGRPLPGSCCWPSPHTSGSSPGVSASSGPGPR